MAVTNPDGRPVVTIVESTADGVGAGIAVDYTEQMDSIVTALETIATNSTTIATNSTTIAQKLTSIDTNIAALKEAGDPRSTGDGIRWYEINDDDAR